jgi:hypothetical protein
METVTRRCNARALRGHIGRSLVVDTPPDHPALGFTVILIIGSCVLAAVAWGVATLLVDYLAGGA